MNEINRLNETELIELVKEFVRTNMQLKSSEIADLVNSHVLTEHGYNPDFSEFRIRAYKYWERVGSDK